MEIIPFLSSELLNFHSWELLSPSLPETGPTLRGTKLPGCTLRNFSPPLRYWYQFPAALWAAVPQDLLISPGQTGHETLTPALLVIPSPSGLAPAVLQPELPHHLRGLPSIKGQLHFLQRKYSAFDSSICTLLFSASSARFYSSCFKVLDSHKSLQLQCSSAGFNKWLEVATKGWLVLGVPSSAWRHSQGCPPIPRDHRAVLAPHSPWAACRHSSHWFLQLLLGELTRRKLFSFKSKCRSLPC